MADATEPGLFGNLAGLGALLGGGWATAEAFNRLGGIGDTAWERGTQIGQDAQADQAFEGYGVTSPTGQAQVDAQGNTTLNLSPDQQALQDQLLQGAGGMFASMGPGSQMSQYARDNQAMLAGMMGGFRDQATGSISQRQNDIFGQLQDTMRPEQERARLNMENRLRSQGRLGVQTGMYGGTGEQFAQEKAIAEANNAAFAQARSTALAEQTQGNNLLTNAMNTQLAQGQGDAQRNALMSQAGRGMLASAYAPQSALLDAFSAGSQAFGYEDIARRQGAGLAAEGASAGLNAYLGANLGQANLLGNLGSSILGGVGQAGLFEGLWDNVTGLFGGS